MLSAITILMGCQLVGEVLRDALDLPVPGPVIGMFLLAVILIARHKQAEPVPRALATTSEALISCMGLLFVPAGVGLIAQVLVLRQEWLPILAGVVGSTLLSLAATGAVMHGAMHWSDRRRTRTRPNAGSGPNAEVRPC